jgi:hypothetical protein
VVFVVVVLLLLLLPLIDIMFCFQKASLSSD